MSIRLFITDIDGVWTDGGMYYDDKGGIELKKFNTSDSAGVLFLRLAGIKTAVITGENTPIVRRRAEKLQVDDLIMGARNKRKAAETLLAKYGLSWEEVAFIGDDLNDIPLLRVVGLSACPASAEDYIQSEVDWVMERRGGEGVFREFVQKYLLSIRMLDTVIARYLASVENLNE